MKSVNLFPILLVLTSPAIDCYKYLAIVPFPVSSHWMWNEHFIRELVNRGHEVTVLTNFRTKNPHPNYTEIIFDPPFDLPGNFPKHELFELLFATDFQIIQLYVDIGYQSTKHALEDKQVQEMIERTDLHFDGVILEQFYHDAFLMFGQKYNAPLITIGTMGISDFMDSSFGMITPWSHVPHFVLSWDDNMNYSERVYNTILSLKDMYLRQWVYFPLMNDLAQLHFASLGVNGTLPTMTELNNRISLMLINNHRSMYRPRPTMPGLVSVGGAHIKPPKPLPNDIQKFLDESPHGAIYFSLGSYVKSTEMPKDKLKIFVETFGRLKQRVLWKYEDETMANIPSNVMIRKWMPQSDILAHPKIILFISHGGMFGTQEGIYHGVPMLFTPLYGDQHRNSIKAKNAGYALSLKFTDITAEELHENIAEMVTNKKYYNRAKEVSRLFRDNPIHPMDEAMYWIEYVTKYHGAPHLKSAAVNLSWYSYLLLDVVALFLGGILFIIGILYVLTRRLCGSSNSGKMGKNQGRKKVD